ncbi:MAG TPA: M24 family metallopeptidase [Vicinamibacterales bacterium]|nr:M24 family metallopeptidase [Vicinamibacterales bacterium]
MPIDVARVQAALRARGLDGWLLYDFHGSNPIATHLAGLAGGGATGHMTTRRWYYLVPATGEPRSLVHVIERHNLDSLPGATTIYAGRQELADGLRQLLAGLTRVAMEYSPGGAIPYVSRVDAGTVEAIRQLGVDVVSSGDLVQQFEAVWDAAALASHREASERLYRVKDRAFAAVRDRLQAGTPTTEYDIQQLMVGWFGEEGLVSDSAPNVSAGGNAGNPHYLPGVNATRPIGRNEIVLLDLWGKRDRPGAVYADITWVGFTGPRPPAEYTRAFDAVRGARDAALALVQEAARTGRALAGFEVDRAARAVLERAGYGPQLLHRTGHSLGTEVHGNGVNLDDYETHDDRRLLPGTGFTIEPGVYFDTFGIRSEINVVMGEHDATVTGPMQPSLVLLG